MTSLLCSYCTAPLARRPGERADKFAARATCNQVCARRQQARLGLNNRRFPPDREDWWRPIAPPPVPYRFTAAGGYLLYSMEHHNGR